MPLCNDSAVAARQRAWREEARRAAEAMLADTPEEWMDAMIQRFLLETSKQLEALEQTKAPTIPEQAQHARTLTTLGRNFVGFAHMHAQRLTREQKVAMSDDELREAFQRRLVQLADAGSPGDDSFWEMPRRELEYRIDAWETWARDAQWPPTGAWRIWLFLGGRGAGKTRAGAEWIADGIAHGRMRRVALVGATHADARSVMIEGTSGLLAAAETARYEPANARVLWPGTGAIAHVLSAEEPLIPFAATSSMHAGPMAIAHPHTRRSDLPKLSRLLHLRLDRPGASVTTLGPLPSRHARSRITLAGDDRRGFDLPLPPCLHARSRHWSMP